MTDYPKFASITTEEMGTAQERRKGKTFIAHWGAFCCGLGLCNQHTLVLYVLIIIPWVLYRLFTLKELSFLGLVSLGFCFIAGFFPYIYLPISSYLNSARWSWGDQTTVSGLLTHLLRAEYGTFSLVRAGFWICTSCFKKETSCCCSSIWIFLPFMVFTYTFLCFIGKHRDLFSWLLTAMLLVYSLFFAWRANLDISRPLLLGVVCNNTDAAVCVLAGLGLSHAHSKMERWLGHGGLWKTIGWVFVLALLGQMGRTNHR
uniref:Transmembrane protein 260 n=1 Tax=Xiphophorus couchianus TaxID=32473 RepID=A0A3B5LKN2_9TELE